MGEKCYQVVKNISHIDHVAIVPDPEDKRLRFPKGDRCRLTLRMRGDSAADGEADKLVEDDEKSPGAIADGELGTESSDSLS